MSKFYNLIGAEVPIEPWIITYQDLPPELPVLTHTSHIVSASRWPLLYFEQIPTRLLKNDPGFPILLRAEKSIPLPSWVFNPVLQNTAELKGRYLLESPLPKLSSSVLFVCSTHDSLSWDKIKEQFPAKSHHWLWLGLGNEEKPNFPIESEVSILDVMHFKTIVPDLLVDLHFGSVDTYGPIHLYCLQTGASIQALGIKTSSTLKPIQQFQIIGGSRFLIY